ncbi:YhgE/Pip family protein [Leucobacter sp. HY1908]
MKNIARIFRNDARHVRRNAIAIVVLFGVVVLPSFFGWFNVLSSWDPFSNVKNLKVAVANADEGYESELFPMRVNVGDQVIANLRANNDLNWVFASEEEAIEGTKAGDYYATLVLPPSFSRDMMTFLSPGAEPAKILYYSNEKENALAPEITNEAATEVSTTINQTFTKTLNEVGLALITSLAKEADSEQSRAALGRLETSTTAAANAFASSADTLELFSGLIGTSQSLVSSAASLADASVQAVTDASGVIGTGASAAQSLQAVLGTANTSISGALEATAASYQTLIDELSALDDSFAVQAQDTATLLTAAAGQVSNQIASYTALRTDLQAVADASSDQALKTALGEVDSHLDNAIKKQQLLEKRLEDGAANLETTAAGMGDTQDEVIKLATDARTALNSAHTAYDENLRPKLDDLGASLTLVNGGFEAISSDLVSASETLSGGSTSLLGFLEQAEKTTADISKDLRQVSERLTKLASALNAASVSGDLSEVLSLIGNSPSLFAGELTTPVGLERIAVFKVDTFGAQMAPFYTVLGLWVGALLLSVLIRTDVVYNSLASSTPFTKTQEYFGRYGIFAVLAFFQSSLLFLGLMGFVGVRPAHPLLLLLAGWVMSFVFSLITYTLVLSFGEAGKALAVFLLVVQISAGGGAYPLAVLPQWFQNISPWLPVSHATNAVRAAIAGIYEGDYWQDIGMLALFLVPTLLIGLVLRIPVLKINNDLTRALESTKLM